MRMPKFFSSFRLSACPAHSAGGAGKRDSRMPGKWSWKMLGLLAIGLGLAAGGAHGQGRTIEGVVKDGKTGQPLPGVSVQIQGTASGTITNDQGVFHLNLPPDHDTLIISYVGYARQVVPVGSNALLQITMQQSAASLNELVVIGYGTQQKKDLTGSIATVNAGDFQQGVISTPDQLIQGKIPGVVITPSSGMPGAGGVIRIRGGASLNASNDPLIVIDGVPLANSGIAGSPNPLTLINPEDIESITVLKDASAAAIYGNRASNGVIIITTKKGTAGGKLSVNLNTVNSLSTKTKEVSVLSAQQLRDIINQQGTAQQKALLGNANTNWQDEIYQTAFSTDNNISFTGGIPQLPYRLSVGYLDQNGILKTGYLKRTSVDLSLTPSFFNHSLKATINLKGAYNNNRFANQAAIGDALRMDPTQPVYDPNSKFGGYFEWTTNTGDPNTQATRNPVADLMLRSDKSTVKRSIGNIELDYTLPALPDLKAHVNAGYDISKGEGNVVIPAIAAMDYLQGGFRSHYQQYNRNELFDFYLNYAHTLPGLKSHFDVTAGYEYQDFFRGSPSFPNLNEKGDTLPGTPLPDSSRHTLVSFYARLNYAFRDKYLLTATIRRDGSSRFSPSNRWGNFPSVALAWRINQEGFLRDSRTVSDLKLRLGYGVTGQQEIGNDYPYLPIYTLSSNISQYPFGNSFYYTYRAEAYDENIKWEQTATYNVGLDFGFLNQRINGSVDVYYKKTTNLLADITTPALGNLSNHVFTNIGSLEDRGIEFSVNATPVTTQRFTWNLNFNIAYNQNKILKLSNSADSAAQNQLVGHIAGGTGNTIQINTVGYPAYTFYVYKQVYDPTGHPIEGVYEDVNNDPNNLFYRYKSPDPKVTLGFSSQFSYQHWTLSFVARADIGNYVYNNVLSTMDTYNSISNSLGYIGNASTDYLFTKFQNSQYFSDYYVENASFLRMDNITLGYNFGRIAHSRVQLAVNAFVQNAFVITKYRGLNPEVFGGIDNNVYPIPRTYALGLNIHF